MDFTEIRAKYPQYGDMGDQEFADKFHAKFYADMPKEQFYQKVGFSPQPGLLSNIKEEAVAGAKGVAGAFTPTQEVPIESQAPEAFGGMVGGETVKAPNIAAAVPAAVQMAAAPLTGAGKTLEQGMIAHDPALGKSIEVPVESQAPEAFGGVPTGQTMPSIPLATQARFALENALLPAYVKLLGVGAGAAGGRIKSIHAADVERASTTSEELAGLLAEPIAIAPEEAAAREAGASIKQIDTLKAAALQEAKGEIADILSPQTGSKMAGQSTAAAAGRGITEFSTPEEVADILKGRMAGKSVEQLQTELNDLDTLTKLRYPQVGPFPSAQAGEPGLAARGPIGTQTAPAVPSIPAETVSTPRPEVPTPTPDAPGVSLPTPVEDVPKPSSGNPWWNPFGGANSPYGGPTMYGGAPGWDDIKKFWQTGKPLPSQADLRTALQARIKSGMDPMQAVDAAASELGRHPGEIIQALRATPAESASTNIVDRVVRGAALDETMPPTVKNLSDALVGPVARKHTGIEPPIPRPVYGRTINKAVPAIGRDIGAIEREVRSNNIVSANHFGTVNNPINDHFSAQLNYMDDALRDQEWHSNIVKHLNLKEDVKASLQSVQTQMGGLFDEFVALHEPKAAASKELNVLRTQLSHMEEGSARHTQTAAKIEDLLKQHQKDISDPLKILYARRDRILYGDPEAGTTGLAQQHPNIRIKLAAGGDKRAQAMLTQPEKEIVEQVRSFYDGKKNLLKGKGIRTIDEDYTNFVFKNALADDSSRGLLDSMWYRKTKPTPAVLDFIQRTPGSKDWFPLLSQSLDAYIPSVNKKLNFTDFLDKWAPMVPRWAETGYPGASQWLGNFLKSQFSPEAGTATSKVMNYYIGSQYLRTLFGNASVPVLHAFKLLQTAWWRGPINFLRAATTQYPKALFDMIAGLHGPERQALEYYIKIPQLMRTIEQQPGMAGAEYLRPGFWTRMGTSLTAMAEHVGNGMSVLTTLDQAAGRGIKDLQVIHNEILDTMMRLDFRGFNMPNMMNEHRALTMFQGQPFKLSENKANMIAGMLQGKEDAFGDKYLHKFIRMVAVLGGAYTAGAHMGVDLTKHLMHLPFGAMEIVESAWQKYKEGGTAGEIGMAAAEAPLQVAPPPIQALAKAADPKQGLLEAAKDQLDPVLLDKIARIKMGEPSLRYETANMEFFGLPKLEGAEESRSLRERRKLLDAYKHPIATEYKKSPSRRLMEEYLK